MKGVMSAKLVRLGDMVVANGGEASYSRVVGSPENLEAPNWGLRPGVGRNLYLCRNSR